MSNDSLEVMGIVCKHDGNRTREKVGVVDHNSRSYEIIEYNQED